MSANVRENVHVHRVVLASPEVVFNAWLDPEIRAEWWCASPEHECSVCEIDGTEGGTYRLGMKKGEQEWIVVGEFKEIKPYEKLQFTWTWEHDPNFGGDSLVTVLFNAIDMDGTEATEIFLTHEKLSAPIMRSEHNHGWVGCLHSLSLKYGPPAECA